MEHHAQAPVIERPGAEDSQNGDTQQQQMEGVTANTDSHTVKSTKQSSSPFIRLPRNVIERYVPFSIYISFSCCKCAIELSSFLFDS